MKNLYIKSILVCSLFITHNTLIAGELSQDHVVFDLTQLSRDSDVDINYLYDNNGTVNSPGDDTVLATTGNFNDDADVGYRLSGSKKLSGSWSINLGIMSAEMESTDLFSDATGQLEIFRNPLTTNFDAAHSVQAVYSSELSSEEVNAVYQYSDNVDFIVGLGHLSLDESFKIISDDTAFSGVGRYTINTSNDMSGVHAGVALSHKTTEDFGFFLVGKVGWYNNDTKQNQQVTDLSFTRNNTGSSSESSTVYDLRLGVNYYFTRQFVMNLAYQTINISNVALASSHFNTTQFGSDAVNSSDDINWDGLNLGVSYIF